MFASKSSLFLKNIKKYVKYFWDFGLNFKIFVISNSAQNNIC